jgi:uncharacterized FlaG/YvyC family protein
MMNIQREQGISATESLKTTAQPNLTPQPSIPAAATSDSKLKSPEQIEQRVNNLQKQLQTIHDTQFQMEYDKEIDRVIVRYVSHTSGEVVRQIPSEKFVDFEKEFVKMVGLLFDQKA